MKNREWLREQSEYDLLTEMNATFTYGEPHCILELIEGKHLICKCNSCNECIAEWLNEERR